MASIDPTVLQLLVATILPLFVGLVTTKVADPGVKAVGLAVLAALVAIASAALESGGVVASETIIEGFQNFVVAVATYYGVWKPTQVAGKVQDRTADIGLTIKSG